MQFVATSFMAYYVTVMEIVGFVTKIYPRFYFSDWFISPTFLEPCTITTKECLVKC